MENEKLMAEYGRLELERRVHLSRMQATEQLQQQVQAKILKAQKEPNQDGNGTHPSGEPPAPEGKCND